MQMRRGKGGGGVEPGIICDVIMAILFCSAFAYRTNL